MSKTDPAAMDAGAQLAMCWNWPESLINGGHPRDPAIGGDTTNDPFPWSYMAAVRSAHRPSIWKNMIVNPNTIEQSRRPRLTSFIVGF